MKNLTEYLALTVLGLLASFAVFEAVQQVLGMFEQFSQAFSQLGG